MNEPEPGTAIPLGTLPNLRDLGGWATTTGGVVRRGVLFRSTDLAKLDDTDAATLGGLGIRTVYDLRTAAERSAEPDRSLHGVREVVADVLADAVASAPADVLSILHDPHTAETVLGGGKAVPLFEQAYREIVTSTSALSAYRLMFEDLADSGARPALFHCTTGKDRTGWAAATLLMLAGVSDEDVMREYLLTNEQLLPALQPMLEQFRAAGGDPDLLRPILGVDPMYLGAALAEMRSTYGTVEGYVTDGLGLRADAVDALRAALVEQP